ncbi:GNAT family N-acetyltransferase [Nonomuraea sp. SMC257]|uniref:GNAT family N-acetyltransferase n=1 Tax=Nonomuraea montanisoli TaxID=2741721 RepID=A0A7Y6I1M9_9ACTN|nr:N-acetyltransferase [Nonomuraea montanisoli]NUW30052.1 GNAT family N-acetyltransferase [Nonomuraea montanisoli]
MLSKRPYVDADLPLLQEGMAGWIACAGRCGYDHIGELPHRIYENLRGRRPVGEVVHVWEHAGTPAGLTVNTRFGNAFDVFTAPGLRGAEAEITMIEDAAATTGRDADEVLTDVWDCDHIRIELLERLGFTRFRVWDDVQEMALAGTPPEPEPPAGFTVRQARLSDAAHLAEARNGAFQAGWTTAEYLDEVMRKPGYDPAREIVAEAPDGRIAAFAVYWTDDRNGLGHFEPVGTHPDFRRRGLARAVMLHAMHRMRPLTTVTVNHNAENLAARKLYESIGFTPRHQTYGYRRHP